MKEAETDPDVGGIYSPATRQGDQEWYTYTLVELEKAISSAWKLLQDREDAHLANNPGRFRPLGTLMKHHEELFPEAAWKVC